MKTAVAFLVVILAALLAGGLLKQHYEGKLAKQAAEYKALEAADLKQKQYTVGIEKKLADKDIELAGLKAENERLAAVKAKTVYLTRLVTGPERVIVKGCEQQKTAFDLRVSQLGGRTEAGNFILDGHAELWQTEPPPETLLLSKRLSGTVLYTPAPPPPCPSTSWLHDAMWGLGGLGLGVLASRLLP